MRAQVLTLFGRCDHDVGVMMERIVRSLQETGRSDLSLNKDANAAVITLSQGIRHAPARFRGDFLHQLGGDIDNAAILAGGSARQVIHTASAAYEEHRKAQEEQFAAHAEQSRSLRARRRCFPWTSADERLQTLPVSDYNGNYILRRYGGCFPPHARYRFYRRFGMTGQGASSSEYHNLPLGDAPTRD